MELHRIVAPDASKATAEALRLYGPEALVVSTRRLKNDRTEVIVATEAPVPPAANAPAGEGKAFKAAFEAQLESALATQTDFREGAPPPSAPTTAPPREAVSLDSQPTPPPVPSRPPQATQAARTLAKARGLDLKQVVGSGSAGQITQQDVQRALRKPPQVQERREASALNTPPTPGESIPPASPETLPEGLALLTAIHEELARLRSELGALKQAQRTAADTHTKDRLEALGLSETVAEALLERIARGDLAPLPKLSEGNGAQAQWLAGLLSLRDSRLNPQHGTHILRAEDGRLQGEMALALALEAERQQGQGSALLITVGTDLRHWKIVAEAALEGGLQLLRATDAAQLSALLQSPIFDVGLRIILPSSGEIADHLRQVEALKTAPRHQILSATRLSSPFNDALLGGSETDTIMVHGLHKGVPLQRFVATMLERGKPLSALCQEDGELKLSANASLTVMAQWADRGEEPKGELRPIASPWPLAAQG